MLCQIFTAVLCLETELLYSILQTPAESALRSLSLMYTKSLVISLTENKCYWIYIWQDFFSTLSCRINFLESRIISFWGQRRCSRCPTSHVPGVKWMADTVSITIIWLAKGCKWERKNNKREKLNVPSKADF